MIRNAASLLTSDVVNRAATLVVYVLIAHHLGAADVGKMALALALFYAFHVLAAAGVRTIITREVAKDAASVSRHVTTGALLVTLTSMVSFAALFGFVRVMGYPRDTAAVVLLLGLGLLPSALSVVCEAVFQAFERMRYIAYAHVPVHVVRVGLAYLFLRQGHGVHHVAVLMLACHVAVALLEWWMLLRYLARPRSEPSRLGRFASAGSALAMARAAGTFVGIDGLIAVYAGLNIVLLSALAEERAVGLYSAASQLRIPATLVCQSVVASVFPALCRRFAGGAEGVAEVLSRMLAVLLALAVPTAVGLFFLAERALVLLYGDVDFVHASPALRVMCWTLVPAALTSVLGQVLLAGSRERVTLRIVAINLAVGLAAGPVLIAKFGLMGAAAVVVLTSVVNVWQHYRLFSRMIPVVSLHVAGWKPVVAGLGMAVYLAVAGEQPIALAAAAACAVYCAVMLALVPRQLRTAVSQVWPQ